MDSIQKNFGLKMAKTSPMTRFAIAYLSGSILSLRAKLTYCYSRVDINWPDMELWQNFIVQAMEKAFTAALEGHPKKN